MAGKILRKNVKSADRVVTIQDNYIVEQATLTALESTSKSLMLANLPASSEKVTLDLIGGTSQKQNKDYYVDGQFLKWDDKTLETVLAEGDELRIIYAI